MFLSSRGVSPDTDVEYYWQELGLQCDPFSDELPHYFKVSQWEGYFELLAHLSQHSNVMEVVLGEPGVGKTSFLSVFARNSAGFMSVNTLRANPKWSKEHFIHAINISLGFAQNEVSSESLEMINAHLPANNFRSVIAIDNASDLSEDILLLLKEWSYNVSSDTRLRFILTAAPSFRHRLKLLYTDQELQKLLHIFELKPLDQKQLQAYLEYRLKLAGFEGESLFSAKEIKKIYKESSGNFVEIHEHARKTLIDKLFKKRNITLFIQDNSKIFLFSALVLIFLSALLFTRRDTLPEGNTRDLLLPTNQFDLSKDISSENDENDSLADDTILDELERSQGVPSWEDTTDEIGQSESVDSTEVPTKGEIPISAIVPASAESTTKESVDRPVTPEVQDANNVESQEVVKEREKLILMEPGNNYTIQLLATSTPLTAIQFIKRHRLEEHGNYYISKTRSKTWYSVIYGSYKSKEDARLAVTKMPFKLRKNNPWIRKYQDIQKAIIISGADNT